MENSSRIGKKRNRTIDKLRWIASMAMRDSRGHRRKLFLFALCIVFGIGALVAIQSFRENLESAIDEQAQTLLGADLSIRSRLPFSKEAETFIASLEGEQARETRFRSMAFFVERSRSRLVQVRALEGAFPFYGEFETSPSGSEFRNMDTPLALVEESLLHQYGVKPGQMVKLGELEFKIAGGLVRVSGENEIRGIFAPRVYIDRRHLPGTGLIKRGSMTRYCVYFQFPNGITRSIEERLDEAKKGLFADERMRMDTVERRKRNLGRALNNIYDYLNLIGFIALLLGGLGVAGAVQVYLKEKLNSVAILRCLGARMRDAFGIYFLQILGVGLGGSLMGAILGVGAQYLLPAVLAPFLPFSVELYISWRSIILSVVFGWVVTILFALIPLLTIRRVTPLKAIRVSFELPPGLRKDPVFWIVALIIVGVVLVFCFSQTSRPLFGFGFAAVLASCLLLLSILASVLRWSLRRFLPRGWPYPWRQGLSNLYRPQNRTLFLVVILGMGTFLVFTIYHAQAMLLQQAEFRKDDVKPNTVLFDVQSDQVESVTQLVVDAGYPALEVVPVVTMRLAAVDGRGVADIKNDPNSAIENWALNLEYRSTFRGHLIDTEEVVAGNFDKSFAEGETVPLSVEESIAKELKVGLGDTLTFDVQGVPIETVISSIRKVDWAKLRPNFYMLFPEGVLEEAPAFFALVTRVPDRLAVISLQQRLGEKHANVSLIDLSLVLDTVTAILDRVAFVIRFMASFTVATGLVVLAVSVITSRYQRIQESALLSTLGASSRLIRRIMIVEYLLVGAISGTAGVFLSLLSAWGLSRYVFEIHYTVSWGTMPLAVLIVCLLTLATGLASSRGVLGHPPLVVLRKEY